MTCSQCAYPDGLHEPGCPLMTRGWESLKPRSANPCQAIEALGYQIILAVGYGKRADGGYSVKVAAPSVLRQIEPDMWEELKEHVVKAFEQLYTRPMDDLEWER